MTGFDSELKRYKCYNQEVLSPSIIIIEHFVRIFEDGEGWDFGSPKHVEDLLGVVLGDFRTPLDGDWTSSSTTFFRVLLSCPLPFGGMTKMNKRHKGPHIVHLSTMCNLFWGIGQSSHLVFAISLKNTNLVEDVEISLPVKFHWILFNRFRREVENVSTHQRPGAAILFFRSAKKNFVEDIEILFPVKFCWIPFRSFRGEVVNFTANQRPGQPSCFSDRPEKHKLCRGRWDLVSCQVSLNSVQQFLKRSRKCLSQSEARAAILFFFIGPKKHKLGRGRYDLASCRVLLNSVQRFQRRSRKYLSQSEATAAILFFPIGPKNTNLVAGVEILLLSSFV